MLSKKSESFLWQLRMTLLERGKDEQAINEIEDELKDHLIEAEAHGQSIDEITGGSVKAYINKISKEMPKDTAFKRFIAGILGVLFILTILPDFFSGSFTLSIGKLIQFLIVIVDFISFWLVVKYLIIHYGSEIEKTNKLSLKIYGMCFLFGLLGFGALMGGAFISKHWPIYHFITLSPITSMMTGFIIAVIALSISAYYRYWPIVGAIIILTLPEIITLIIFQDQVHSESAQITSGIILFSLSTIASIGIYIYFKKHPE